MTTKRPLSDAPQVAITSLADLTDWLSAHHTQGTGVWLIHPKKASPDYIPFGKIVDELLCWGWIDSLSRSKDDLRTMHYIAPRNPASNWSRVNKDKIARLEATDRLRAPGRAMIATAKARGTWTALDDVENGVTPDDLTRALEQDDLRPAWDALPRSVRRGALEILFNAKRAATRAKKIDEICTALRAGSYPFQWVGKS